MKSTSLGTFKVKFLTCNLFIFYKNVLYRLLNFQNDGFKMDSYYERRYWEI